MVELSIIDKASSSLLSYDDNVYAFIIDKKVIFDVPGKKLVYRQDESAELPFLIKMVSLSDTQSRLLNFMLINREKESFHKDELMVNVWDSFGMSSSYQRLWQSINDLRRKLSAIGLEDDIIISLKGVGYKINKQKIRCLYMR